MPTTFDEFGNEIITPQAQITQQNAEFKASGGADDDSGSPTTYYENDGTPSSNKAETTTYYENDGTSSSTNSETTTYYENDGTASSTAGTTVAGKSSTTASKASEVKPGKRLFNPLGNYPSYTYQITLYMITPDAYDAFIASGRKDISAIAKAGDPSATNAYNNSEAGAYIIAQSGGINNTSTHRAPGFNLDYYIDDLQIKTATNGKATGTSSNVTSLTFKILEPYGFSFITKLKTAAAAIQRYSATIGLKSLDNASKQFFVLGVKFLGYDQSGTPVNDIPHQQFYDIILTSIKFKLDGKATTYIISAATTAPQTAYGTKRGRLINDLSATCTTVQEALIGDGPGISGIFTQLNQQQIDMKNAGSIKIPNKYNVKFLGQAQSLIAQSSVINKFADPDKTKWPLAQIKDSNQVNDKVAVSATPDNTKRIVSFKSDTSIQQLIQLVISQSSYVEDALKVLYTTATEPDEKTDSPEDIKPKSNRTLKWYNVSAEVKNLGFDDKVNDFAFEITYIVQPYDTPVVMAVTAGKTTTYYGPHKRYEYWFTGKNSEILEYSQSLDNSYFNVAVESTGSDASTGGGTDVPMVAGKRQNVQRQGKLGIGAEAQNAYVNYLIDPGSYAAAKISILGDPDFLIQDSTTSIDALYNQFYGTDGFTISANGGQVFIEIDFKEAIDYNNQTGVMDINESLVFWKYPPKIKKIVKGISYMVIEVSSNFRGGKFTQDLSCVVNTFGNDLGTDDTDGREKEASKTRSLSNQGGAGSNNPTGSDSTGLMQDDATGVDEAVAYQQALNEADQADAFYNGSQGTSNTGSGSWGDPVSDDDSNSSLTAYNYGADEGRE